MKPLICGVSSSKLEASLAAWAGPDSDRADALGRPRGCRREGRMPCTSSAMQRSCDGANGTGFGGGEIKIYFRPVQRGPPDRWAANRAAHQSRRSGPRDQKARVWRARPPVEAANTDTTITLEHRASEPNSENPLPYVAVFSELPPSQCGHRREAVGPHSSLPRAAGFAVRWHGSCPRVPVRKANDAAVLRSARR